MQHTNAADEPISDPYQSKSSSELIYSEQDVHSMRSHAYNAGREESIGDRLKAQDKREREYHIQAMDNLKSNQVLSDHTIFIRNVTAGLNLVIAIGVVAIAVAVFLS